jgi:YbgC/YbaW family acyl-CoA thioester hydrolase
MKDYSDTTVRVRYAETDQMGLAYYGNYFTWFEIGRVEFCRQVGFEYKQMEIEDDSFIVVAEASCRYKRPARFDDLLIVRTRLRGSQRRTIRFAYEIFRRTSEELIATGETVHVICDRQGRPKTLPEKYRTYFPLTDRTARSHQTLRLTRRPGTPMSAPDPAQIDRYRDRLRREWTEEATVSAWRKWQAKLAEFTRGATEAILEAAQPRAGARVLDLASGVGDPSLSLAEAVGPAGHVTATDLGPGMIGLAEELARARGVSNIEFRVADVEALPFPGESFDVVTCRFGVMFFPDQLKAFGECRRVLRTGGRVAFLAWGKPEQAFLSTTVGILAKYVEVPPPDPGAPHAFMFGQRGLLKSRLEAAGFAQVREEVRTVPARWVGSAEEYWQQFTEVAAPFRPLVAKLTAEARARAESEIFAALRRLSDGEAITMPLEIVVGTGLRA